ncbi:MAG: DUF2971 domain-containing protein [Microbacterium sp.]
MDPRERVPLNFGLGVRGDSGVDDNGVPRDDPDGSVFMRAFSEANEIARKRTQMLCFSNSYEPLNSGFQMDGDGDRGWAQAAMWTHFGGRHSGVCLELDREVFIRDYEEANEGRAHLLSGDVSYPNSGDSSKHLSNLVVDVVADATSERIYGHLVQNSTAAFFTKDANWSYEDEFRVVALATCGESIFAPVGGSLKRLILGDGVDPVMVEAIRWNMVQAGLNADVDRMFWHSSATFSPYRLEREIDGEGVRADSMRRPAKLPKEEHVHSPSCIPAVRMSADVDNLRESRRDAQFQQLSRKIVNEASMVASEYDLGYSTHSGLWVDREDPQRSPARRSELVLTDPHSEVRLEAAVSLREVEGSQLLVLEVMLTGEEAVESEWPQSLRSPDQTQRENAKALTVELSKAFRRLTVKVRQARA